MSVTPSGSAERDPLWELVPVADYQVPKGLDQHLVRKKWAALRRLLRSRNEETATPVRTESELRALPGVRLENLVPPIDWAAAVPVLQGALDPGPSKAAQSARAGLSVCFLIGQPHGAHGEILMRWAATHGATLISPPSPEAILAADPTWMESLDNAEGPRQAPWVLPNLEHCFLRHAAGLSLIRQLLEGAATGRLGDGLIGCDSWAWAYLQRIFPTPQLRALTLQAFDGRRLAALFLGLCRHSGGRPLRFRNASTGAPVLPEPEALIAGEAEIGRELRQLAAHCRGNPGIAWHYWRKRLRTEPETESAADGPPENPGGLSPKDTEILWLSDALEDPVPPAEQTDDLVFILHALLLHNGLPGRVLPEVLPLPQGQIASLLARLEALRMVELVCNRWRVAALAYPTARAMLRERSFLVDPF